MLQNKAQGTIEYLVIIAIVVVIALVVVGLLLQVMGQGSGIPEQTARTAWKSASPFAIVDWSKAADGNITLVLRNNSYESLGLYDLNISSTATDGNTDDSTNIAPGSTVTRIIATASTCTAGERYAYPKEYIFITYRTPTIASDRRESAAADLVGTCS